MLGLCKEGHYPGYGERYKEKNLPPQLLTGAVYNGVYRALQADYSPNYDVDCLLAEGSINRYILLIFDTFLEDSDNFGRVGDNCVLRLSKSLEKFFKTCLIKITTYKMPAHAGIFVYTAIKASKASSDA